MTSAITVTMQTDNVIIANINFGQASYDINFGRNCKINYFPKYYFDILSNFYQIILQSLWAGGVVVNIYGRKSIFLKFLFIKLKSTYFYKN